MFFSIGYTKMLLPLGTVELTTQLDLNLVVTVQWALIVCII